MARTSPGRIGRGPATGRALALALVGALTVTGVAALGGCGSRTPHTADASDASGTPTAGRGGLGPASAPPGTADPATSAPPDSPPATAGPDAQQRRFAAATALVRRQPGVLGIVVRDRRTGTVWRAGTTDHLVWTASTIKLAMVVGLLERSRAGEITLDATARTQIAAILDTSDDNAATALWNRYGQDAQLARFQQRYGMAGLTTVAGFPRFWGHLKCAAEDLAHLMSYVLDRLDPTDRGYLLGAMRHVGTIQRWGVWAAGPAQRPGTKDGWSIEPDSGGKHWVTNTVGFAGDRERYVVAVMYQLPPGRSINAGVHAVSDLVATVFGAPTPARVIVPDPSTGL